MKRGRFNSTYFLIALVVSAGVNVEVFSHIVKSLAEKPDTPIEIEYVDESPPSTDTTADDANQTPDENPARQPNKDKTQEKTTIAEKAIPQKNPEKQKAPEKPKNEPEPPEVAKVEPPKPEPPKPEPPKPPEPPPPPPPPLVEMPKQRMKMVDQDRPDDEPDNADAKYLAQKNHRAAEDVRSLETNLVREMHAPENAPRPSEKSDNNLPSVGDKDRKVAELEDRKGKPDILPRGRPTPGDDGKKQETPQKVGKLSMRNLTPVAAEPAVGPKPREGVEMQEKGPGDLPMARVGNASERERAAVKGVKGAPNLTLDPLAYDKIVGFDTAQKEREVAARGERSHTPGHWDRVQQKMAMVRSSLENFVPEARVGQQQELGTRAHPFAAYIAEMHRQIHKLWAFGFLQDLDAKGMSNPYNDMSLWTQVEIVLKADGSLEKATIVRTSGNASFDIAAVDAVASSAPFPPPPGAIKSANGKVYLDWRFHRDDRQCGTFGVDPHILTNVGENQDHDTTEVAGLPRVAPPRVLRRSSSPTANSGSAPASAPQESYAAVIPQASQPAPAVKPAEEPAPSGEAANTVPDGAKDAADGWFGAYVRGDTRWLAGWSAAPFTADGQVVAKDGNGVKQMYTGLLAEAPKDRRLESFEVLTAAGVRKKRGGLPPGGEGDGNMVYAVARIAGEDLVLLIKKSDHGWRICGIAR